MGRAPHLPRRPFASETAEDERIVAEAMREAHVDGLADRTVPTLSGGERQRVLFARALAQQPDVILLDEPTAHLDLRHQAETLTLARGLAHGGGKAVLAVLHDVNLASAYCDELVLLNAGRIVAQGPPGEVVTAENLREVYGARVWVRRHPASGRPLVLTLPELMDVAEPQTPLRVHVICGGGTGTALLLALHGRGYAVTAAGLNAGDTDAEVAVMLGIPFAREASFSSLSPTVLGESARLAQSADVVLLTDVPFGRANLANLEAALALRRAASLSSACTGRMMTSTPATSPAARRVRSGETCWRPGRKRPLRPRPYCAAWKVGPMEALIEHTLEPEVAGPAPRRTRLPLRLTALLAVAILLLGVFAAAAGARCGRRPG